MSTDVGTWTNWLTFEPDPDSPEAGTGLLSPISYALQRGILWRRENPMYSYWAPVAAATRGFKMVLFTASRGNNFVGGTCALPSALLVSFDSISTSMWRKDGWMDTPAVAMSCSSIRRRWKCRTGIWRTGKRRTRVADSRLCVCTRESVIQCIGEEAWRRQIPYWKCHIYDGSAKIQNGQFHLRV